MKGNYLELNQSDTSSNRLHFVTNGIYMVKSSFVMINSRVFPKICKGKVGGGELGGLKEFSRRYFTFISIQKSPNIMKLSVLKDSISTIN